MNIVPVKSKDQWPLPESSKVIVFSDLYTERNISNPVRITVKSYPKHLWVRKGLKPLYSPSIMVYNDVITSYSIHYTKLYERFGRCSNGCFEVSICGASRAFPCTKATLCKSTVQPQPRGKHGQRLSALG